MKLNIIYGRPLLKSWLTLVIRLLNHNHRQLTVANGNHEFMIVPLGFENLLKILATDSNDRKVIILHYALVLYWYICNHIRCVSNNIFSRVAYSTTGTSMLWAWDQNVITPMPINPPIIFIKLGAPML